MPAQIAIPNGILLHSLSWNPDQGWIACGGDDGPLKMGVARGGTGAGRACALHEREV